MNGRGQVRFTELFTDTIQTHGVVWGFQYYKKHGMQAWEFGFWLRSTGLIRQFENWIFGLQVH